MWPVLDCSVSVWPVLDCSVSVWPVLGCPVSAWPVLDCSVSVWPVLGCPFSLWPVLGCPFLLWPVLGCSVSLWPVLGCPVSVWPVLGCPVSLWPVLGCPVSVWPVLGCSVSLWPVLGCPVSLWPVLGCPVSLWPVLGCPVSVWPVFTGHCSWPRPTAAGTQTEHTKEWGDGGGYVYMKYVRDVDKASTGPLARRWAGSKKTEGCRDLYTCGWYCTGVPTSGLLPGLNKIRGWGGGGGGYFMLGDYKIKIRTFGWLVITYSTSNTNTAVSIVSGHADRSSLQVILAGWQWYASQHIFFLFLGGVGVVIFF